MIKKSTKLPLKNTEKKIDTLNEKWNKRLDDFDNYVKEYITHYKKSIRGNSISLLKYPYMKSKSEEIGLKLNKAEKKQLLTEKQMLRKSKINLKIINTCCE
ncbi:hypothetical protein H4V97_001068 [Flavobacterium sp. CG_23.5]|uniref:hypothetical protein n=1 Tax=unclassified Flavobacterium TaxID=196869 RepID=UPI0018CB2521|nr:MULTISPECIES: hypothetical protein [unclassified Flavobacterium]MBG6112046.1 hypothetical protein [Flavobacterium sp. CG_9.10]MBP2282750.1 hypothetical protein [Flavobacterium sp. CG_23.5]